MEERTRAINSRAKEKPEQIQNRLAELRKRATQTRSMAWGQFKRAAFVYNCQQNYHKHPKVMIGKMEIVCVYCEAYKWKEERPGLCCSNGKVKLQLISEPLEPLKGLMLGKTTESKHFLTNIRKYNSCFQMTSFGVTQEIRLGGYMPTFKVKGQVYHQAGSLLPLANEESKFLQIFFMRDEKAQAKKRCTNIPETRENIVVLQEFLHKHNSYVKLFKIALERMPTDEYQIVIKADKTPGGEHERRFNAPTIEEVASSHCGKRVCPPRYCTTKEK